MTLTLANAVLVTDTDVKVSYGKPTSGADNRLRDKAGNEVASFSDEAVTTDLTPPWLVRGEGDGGTMILYVSEALDEDSVGRYFAAESGVQGRSHYEIFPQGAEVEISWRYGSGRSRWSTDEKGPGPAGRELGALYQAPRPHRHEAP